MNRREFIKAGAVSLVASKFVPASETPIAVAPPAGRTISTKEMVEYCNCMASPHGHVLFKDKTSDKFNLCFRQSIELQDCLMFYVTRSVVGDMIAATGTVITSVGRVDKIIFSYGQKPHLRHRIFTNIDNRIWSMTKYMAVDEDQIKQILKDYVG